MDFIPFRSAYIYIRSYSYNLEKSMILIIVDFQNDFVSGSLPVNGAEKVYMNLLQFMWARKKDINKVIFTADWHPANHCSFTENGGDWPKHCLQYSDGAAIKQGLLENCYSNNIPYEVITKGEDPYKEEYGAFSFVKPNIPENEEVVICGIAGDFCVLHTLENLLYLKPKIFLKGIASIDGGIKLQEFIKRNDLDIININN